MGNCSPRSLEGGHFEHEQYAPMWVVKVEDVLEMTGRLQPHQVLKDQGLLVEWSSMMFSVFVSHQWLGFSHPDPSGEQLRVLQSILRNLISGRIKVEHDAVSQINGCLRTLTLAECGRIQAGAIWLDYFSVPQHVGSSPIGEQPQYVRSIPSYVDRCEAFLALTPSAAHEMGYRCNDDSWIQRGWCRLELWCKTLSTRSSIPVIQVTGHDVAQFTKPDWIHNPVHSGDFALEEDRPASNRVVQAVLEHKLRELRSRKNLTAYRFYKACFHTMIGVSVVERSIEEFLSEFAFSLPLKQHSGLGPVACAALAGDSQLVRSLASSRASVNTLAPAMPEVNSVSGLSPLHLACMFRSHDLKLLHTLLELRADINSSNGFLSTPLGWCRTAGAVELLIRHGSGVNEWGNLIFHMPPVEVALGLRAPCEVLAKLLELRADVTSSSPFFSVAFAGGSNNSLNSARMLLGSKADVNQRQLVVGIERKIELAARAYCLCCREPPILAKFFANISTTPLGYAAMFNNEDFLIFLLCARADPEIKNNRNLRPIDLASSERIRQLLRERLEWCEPCPLVSNVSDVSWFSI